MVKLKKLKLNAVSLNHSEMKNISGGNSNGIHSCTAECNVDVFGVMAAVAVCSEEHTCEPVNQWGAMCMDGSTVVAAAMCDGKPYHF